MGNSIDLDYLVKCAVNWFECNEEDSASWRLGRLAVKGKGNKKIRRKLFKETICIIRNRIIINRKCDNFINFIQQINPAQDQAECVFLFVVSWNSSRFYCGNLSKSDVIKACIEALSEILKKKKKIIRSDPKKAYKKVFCILKKFLGQNEKVITAKILMLLNPYEFIAWDNKIMKKFGLHEEVQKEIKKLINLSKKNKKENKLAKILIISLARIYKNFNQAIGLFLKNNKKPSGCLKNKYKKSGYYYTDKKLLDMIFFLHTNTYIDSYFHNEAEKLIEKVKKYL